MRRAVEKDMAALKAIETKRRSLRPSPKMKRSVSRNWRHPKEKSTTPATISRPPTPTGSSLFRSLICSAFWTAATAPVAHGTKPIAARRSPKPPNSENLTQKPVKLEPVTQHASPKTALIPASLRLCVKIGPDRGLPLLDPINHPAAVLRPAPALHPIDLIREAVVHRQLLAGPNPALAQVQDMSPLDAGKQIRIATM